MKILSKLLKRILLPWIIINNKLLLLKSSKHYSKQILRMYRVISRLKWMNVCKTNKILRPNIMNCLNKILKAYRFIWRNWKKKRINLMKLKLSLKSRLKLRLICKLKTINLKFKLMSFKINFKMLKMKIKAIKNNR